MLSVVDFGQSLSGNHFLCVDPSRFCSRRSDSFFAESHCHSMICMALNSIKTEVFVPTRKETNNWSFWKSLN